MVVVLLKVAPSYESTRREYFTTNPRYYGDGYCADSAGEKKIAKIDYTVTAYSRSKIQQEQVVSELVSLLGTQTFLLDIKLDVELPDFDRLRLFRCKQWSIETLNRELYKLTLNFESDSISLGGLLLETLAAYLLEDDGVYLSEDI